MNKQSFDDIGGPFTAVPYKLMLAIQETAYRTEYFSAWFAMSLMQQKFKEQESHEIAGKILCSWFEALLQEPTDDIRGIPLTIEMLPISTTSVLVIYEAIGHGYSDLDVAKIVVAWNDLRRQLYDEVFDPLDQGNPVEEFIHLSNTMYVVPDNDIELSSTLPLRLFTSKQAARMYEEIEE